MFAHVPCVYHYRVRLPSVVNLPLARVLFVGLLDLLLAVFLGVFFGVFFGLFFALFGLGSLRSLLRLVLDRFGVPALTVAGIALSKISNFKSVECNNTMRITK